MYFLAANPISGRRRKIEGKRDKVGERKLVRGSKCEKEIDKEIDRKRISIREGERKDLEGNVFSIITP